MTTFFCKQSSSPAGQGHERMGRGTKVKPQATLCFVPGRPPVLDLTPAPVPAPAPAKQPSTCHTSWPGVMWSHLTSMFSSPPPLYWVNQEMVRDCPLPSVAQYPLLPCPVVDPHGSLWHPAPPGNLQQQMMMDPQQMLHTYTVFPHSKTQDPLYPSSCPPYKTPTKSLNPNAQEWVPREYGVPSPATPASPFSGCVEKKAPPHSPPPSDGCQDFSEITEEEVEAVRSGWCSPPSGVALTPGGDGQCKAAVPLESFVRVCEESESERESTGHSCLESTPAAGRREGVVLQPSKSQSPACKQENFVSPTEESEEQFSVTSNCGERRDSSASARECQGPCGHLEKNCTCLAGVCVSAEESEPASASPSLGCAAPDQSEQTAVITAQRSVPDLSPHKADQLDQRDTSQPPVQPGSSVRAGLEVPSHQCLGSATDTSASLTYAGVVGRASPSPPPPVDTPEQLRYKGVEQPLPRIFQVDRTPHRETTAPKEKEEGRTPEYFRKPSRKQRTHSRKFLQELRDLSHNGVAGGVVCGSSSSSSSSSSPPVLPHTPEDLASPTSSQATASSLPQAIPIPTASLALAESPGRSRSSSESSAASLDIDFVEQDEVDLAPMQRVPLAGGSRNGFLACILGSGDSDSDSEDESDSDWDEVCEEDLPPRPQDSWETFGQGLVVVECQVVVGDQCRAGAGRCEGWSGDPFLQGVNRRWEEEVSKDVRGRSSPRVTFGGEKVHRMVVWEHAYRQARRGPWEQQARDRARFAQRVASLEPALAQVLDPRHRRAVFRRLHAPPPPRCFL